MFAGAGPQVALVLPHGTLYATGHDATGEFAAALSAPSATLTVRGGASAAPSMPSGVLAITGTVANFGAAALTAPSATTLARATVTAGGRTSAFFGINNFLAAAVGYSGAVISATIGSSTVAASGTADSTGAAALRLPLFDIIASGTANGLSSANLLMPAPLLGGNYSAVAWLMSPSAQLVAIGSAVVVATYEAYSINLTSSPGRGKSTIVQNPTPEVTHYTNFPFTQIVRYKNSYYGVAADGLYLLEGTTDNGTAIPWAWKTCLTDDNSPQLKSIPAATFGGRMGPAATVTLYVGESGSDAYSYTTPRGAAAQNYRETFGKGIKTRYYAIGANGTGDVTLDDLDLEVHNLSRRI